MREFVPLAEIRVPAPPRPRSYELTAFGRKVRFQGLKQLLGAADFDKAGERNAGLAAADEVAREAARELLSGLTLGEFWETPLVTDGGRVDAVMRASYDVDPGVLAAHRDKTVGGLKDYLLGAPGAEVARVGSGLTAVMAAALAKLLDVHELVYLARKIRRPTRARTMLGAPGTLSSRLQPNHPVDDLRGVTLLTYVGLSLGAGDALLGLNPSIDTVENVSAILRRLHELRTRLGVPTQICVLSHVKTQLAALEAGAPVEIMFQSLAGTERTLVEEFDCTIELLDRAYRTMAERGPLAGVAEQFMYFETGQGSELTYGKHEGIDMATTEALCYSLARRWDPFMVNNVTGFIGPETHLDDAEMILSNLQDHFMGKLLGVPMGMAPCYTLHSRITPEGQQIATQLLTAAGANYYMDVCLNTDRMLAYFDTSAHDDQTLREVHDKRPAAEYLAWAEQRGIFVEVEGEVRRGPAWGDPRRFCESGLELRELLAATPAMYGFENAGPRPADAVTRRARSNQAVAREAVHLDLDLEAIGKVTSYRLVETRAGSRDAHLGSPVAGARLAEASRAGLGPEPHRVQILIADGLSAAAVDHNIPDLVPVLLDGLKGRGHAPGRPLVARFGRVKLAEEVAEVLGAEVVVTLIGERPGGDARSSRSLSAYLVLRLVDPAAQAAAAAASGNPGIRFEYTVLSNIYDGGLPPAEAGGVIVEKVEAILAHRAAGNRLEARLGAKG